MIDNSTIQMIGTSTIQLGTMGFTALAALSAACAAFLSLRSIKANINTTKSSVLLNCLREYIDIRKDRAKALNEKNPELCFEYYRELLDLHWTEFRLWTMGYIDNEIMESWLNVRYRNYKSDVLTTKDNKGADVRISYRDSWDKLLQENYFEKDDPFTKFMNHAHANEIEEALDMKERLNNENIFSRITFFFRRKGI